MMNTPPTRQPPSQGISSKFMQHSFSTKILPKESFTQQTQNQKTTLVIPNDQLENQISQYQWRQKTGLPIIKINHYKVNPIDQESSEVTVDLDSYPIRLNLLKDLPLFKIIYLLKESLIGLERLVDRVGPFELTSKMIALSPNNKCKIWLNQNFASNRLTKKFINEREFLQTVYAIFATITNKLKSTLTFMGGLKNKQTFCQAISFIQTYAKEQKINISNTCKINQNQKMEKTIENNFEDKPFDPAITMSKKPNFLTNNLRLTLSPTKSMNFMTFSKKNSVKDGFKFSQKKDNPEMKVSGDTAADLFESKSTSFMKKSQELGDGLFKDSYGSFKPTQTKSILPTIAQKKILFGSKTQEKNDYEKHCFTPSLTSKNWQESHHFEFDFHDKAFFGEEEEEDEIDPSKIKQLFSTNNWSISMKGLFGEESPLKRSFHEGKQVRKTEYDLTKLHLLDNLGKQMTQSHISDEFNY